MKPNPSPGTEDPLLDAVLRDETWQITSTAFKAEALGVFRGRQRVRRATRWSGACFAFAVLLACGVHWSHRPEATPVSRAVTPREAPQPSGKPRYMTDRELLASFPEGSCFLAEIDGTKQLVFLDPEVERRYVANPRR